MVLYSLAFVGGFDLAAEWMGWENVFQVEWDSYCQKVLAKNFPNVKRYGDIKEFDGTKYRGLIDIISGGFPCQPYSVAGKRKGKEDERHLWPEMLRVIREIQPSYIVGENVPGIINWSGGLVFQQIQTDLESEGYKIFPIILPACSTDADHRRDRLWFVWHISDSSSMGCRRNKITSQIIQSRREAFNVSHSCITSIQNKQITEFNRKYNGVSSRLDKSRIKCLGNAIVPQVAYQIFKAIEQYELSKI
jgi:DNA-cytosine methyltransferase